MIMPSPEQLSLFPDLVPSQVLDNPVETESKAIAKRTSKSKPIKAGHVVETPVGRGLVLLVSPVGDCYIEVNGDPYVFAQEDITSLNVLVISPETSIREICLEQYAFQKAIEHATAHHPELVTSLQEAWEVRRKFLMAIKAQIESA